MRDEADRLFGAAVVLQDVTRFRLLDDVKSNLVSTVSHELKTPLTSVRMGLHLLLEERIGALNPKQTELLLAAREESERLLKMINDLLDIAKLESGRAGLRLREFRTPRRSCRALKTTCARWSKPADCNSWSKSLRTSRRCSWTAARLTTSFQISFPTPRSTPNRETRLSSRQMSRTEKFGSPSPTTVPAFRRSFNRDFSNASSACPGSDPRGAGLGLAIAREIVTAHGGEIGVVSQPGQGSEFYFILPPANEERIS